MFKRVVASVVLLAFVPAALGACGGSVGQNAASNALKTPELPTDKQAKCRVKKSQSEPLIVEWPDTQRGKLESLTKRGVVAVRYEGCELEVLPRCSVKGNTYAYSPITRKQSTVTIKDEDELYASMPAGAIRLEGKLKSAGQLNVAMTTVGRYEAATTRVYNEDLEGDCSQATHVVAALSVGSFTFSAGADAEVGASADVAGAGGGGKSTASRETIQRDGDEAACARSSNADTSPPEHCGALLQIEVMPITKGQRAVVAPVNPPPVVDPTPPDDPIVAPPTPKTSALTKPPKCKRGEKIIDGQCVKPGTKPKTVATSKENPKGAVFGSSSSASTGDPNGAASLEPTCASGQHLFRGRCVDDEPTPPPEPPPPSDPTCPAGTHAQNGACVVDRSSASAEPSNEPSPYGQPSPYSNPDQPQTTGNPVRTTLLYLGVGAGITALTAGYVALANAEAASKSCNDSTKTCGADFDEKKKSAMTYAIVADVSLGIAALSILGFILLPSSKVKASAAPMPGGGYATVGGTFK